MINQKRRTELFELYSQEKSELDFKDWLRKFHPEEKWEDVR